MLSQIAPVVAYPTMAYQTYWRDQIVMNAEGMGMKAEGEQLVHELEHLIEDKLSEYPELAGKKAAFFYFVPTDLGMFYIYLPTDPRAAFLTDLGMEFPQSVLDLAPSSDSFSITMSAENVDLLHDIDIIIAYGTDGLLETLQADALVGTMPAIANGAVYLLEDGTPIAAAGNPSALSMPYTIDEYLSGLAQAAKKVK